MNESKQNKSRQDKPRQDKLAQQIKSVLDESVQDIDADTRYQLQIARAKVLQSGNESTAWAKHWPVWAGVVSIACISLLTASLLINTSNYEVEEFEMMTSMDNLLFESDAGIELYEEYDFYVWLSEQEANS